MKTQHITRGFTLLAAVLLLAAWQWAEAQTLTHSYTFDNYDDVSQKLWNNALGDYDASILTVGTGTFAVDTAAGTLRLNGTDAANGAYVLLPATLLDGLTSTTITTDVTYASLKNYSRVFDLGSGTSRSMWLGLVGTNATARLEMITSSGSPKIEYGFTTGRDYYFTSVYEATDATTGTMSLYVDGRLIGTQTVGSPLGEMVGTANYLGKSQFNDAYIDATYRSFSVYGDAMDAAAVLADYREHKTGYKPVSDLIGTAVGFWDASGNGLNDISGPGTDGKMNHFTKFENAQFVSLADDPISDTFLGYGYAFRDGNGTNRFTETSTATDLMDISGSLTVSARVNMDSFNTNNDFIRSGRSERFATAVTYELGTTNNGELTFYLTPAGATNATAFKLELESGANFALEEDTWYDVTGVFDADNKTVSLYVYDSLTGALLESSTMDVAFDSLYLYSGNSRNFMLFETPWNDHGANEGMMAYAGVWDYALTADQLGLLAGNANSVNSVPEPATWAMLLLGGMGVWVMRRKRG